MQKSEYVDSVMMVFVEAERVTILWKKKTQTSSKLEMIDDLLISSNLITTNKGTDISSHGWPALKGPSS